MKEFNNREIANKHAEYITSKILRKYAADKVKKYVPDLKTIFDGAAGSGQLEEFINAEKITAVEIQKQAADTLKENFPNSDVYNTSFFLFDDFKEHDASLINPPFSLKYKDQSDEEKKAIQKEFPWKKSGVLDDVFLLKSLKFTKRYGFYILFPGISYRGAEKKAREIIGNRLLELNSIENGFDDTTISVIFIVIDKKKTDKNYYGEIYDCKTQKIKFKAEFELSEDRWEIPREIKEKEKIDIVQVEKDIRESQKNIRKLSKEIDDLIKNEIKPMLNGVVKDDTESQLSFF